MDSSLKKEIYSFVKGVRRKKLTFLLSLPMILYVFHRLILKYLRHKSGVPFNKIVLVPVCILFAIAVVIRGRNIIDLIQLRRRLGSADEIEMKVMGDDFRFGTVYLDRRVIIGKRYIFSNGSCFLFKIDELRGVFNDIRDTYNIVTMALAGADDIVKTKIIKAEFKDKGFLHDRRICEIEVHRKYLSDIGETDGYTQLDAIENEIRGKMGRKE